MTSRRSLTAGFFVTAVFLKIFGSGAMACGFDGLLGDQFSAQHPKSLLVAMAISDAVAKGFIDRGAVAPVAPGQQGYWRAMARLERFAALLARKSDPVRLPNVSILLIDSRLWTRLSRGAAHYGMEAHLSGPATGDVVIVTNEFILAALNEGTLTPRRAFDLGIVAVDGDKVLVSVIQEAIVAGGSPEKSSNDHSAAHRLLNPWGTRPGISQPAP